MSNSFLYFILNLSKRRKEMKEGAKYFFFPKLTFGFLARVILVTVLCILIFVYIAVPVYMKGESMRPTYPESGFNFCNKLAFLFSEPKKGDIVILRFLERGNRIMALKRIVAVEGETVEFRDGKLYIDGKLKEEPYVKNPCDWNRPPLKVGKNEIYVIGDNRSMPIEQHMGGKISKDYIEGAPLW